MVFASVPFLFVFLPAVLAAYFLCPRRWHNAVLLVFSLFFYAWGEPVYILLMLSSITAPIHLPGGVPCSLPRWPIIC